MARTKRKRRSKHRGTAAGTIEARGRTGRPAPAPDKRQARIQARERRMNTPPTWKSALTRAGVAGAFLFIFVLITAKKNAVTSAVLLTAFAVAVYVPAGYYVELYLYRRRHRQRQGPK